MNLLGLAFRANKVVTGQEFVVNAIKSHQAKFVFLASDTSLRTLTELKSIIKKNEINYTDRFTQSELSNAIGRNRKTIAITDKGFAGRFNELIDN